MKRAVLIGAGKKGRGLVGPVLSQSGYNIVITDASRTLVNQPNDKSGYTVHTTRGGKVDVNNLKVISISSDDLIDEIAIADVITVEVGSKYISEVEMVLFDGINRRCDKNIDTPLNILVCEEDITMADQMHDHIFRMFDEQTLKFAALNVVFVRCVIDRITPVISGQELDIKTEEFYNWDIDAKAVRGDLDITGANLVNDIEECWNRKFYIFNTGHVITAYLGFIRGCLTIDEAIAVPEIRSVVTSAMKESCQWLSHKYNWNVEQMNEYIQNCIERFSSQEIPDILENICTNPIQKLHPDECLVRPITECLRLGCPADHLIIGLAAALHYNVPEDPQSVELMEMIKKDGLQTTIQNLTGIRELPLLEKIIYEYKKI